MTKANILLSVLSFVLLLLLIASTSMTIGVMVATSLKEDPKSYAIPSYIVRASRLNLDHEAQTELMSCMERAKVLYMSEAIAKCLDRYDDKGADSEVPAPL